MSAKRTLLGFVAAAAVLLGQAVADAESGPDMAKLPVNEWVKVSGDDLPAAYDYSTPVFVSSRGRVLQWGGSWGRYKVKVAPRDDVRAFDARTGRWVSDQPPSKHARLIPGGHGAAPLGVGWYGSGGMSKAGTPYASAVFGAGCYDAKRGRLIYVMKGLTAAYDPKAKKWRDLGAKTALYGKNYPGGPPVYAISACYDPINDEIVLFPHWAGSRDPKNTDLAGVTGRVSSHLGTFRYSFTDNTWRRAADTVGTGQQKAARRKLLEVMGRITRASDTAYRERRGQVGEDPPNVAAALQRAGRDLKELSVPSGQEALAKAAGHIAEAVSAADKAQWLKMVAACGRAVWVLDQKVLDGPLRVEPPPRCGAPMVYDPKHQAIVMFGGHDGLVRSDIRPSVGLGSRPGVLNDTWAYDCRTRQWRELRTDRRPPGDQVPQMFYDPASKRMVLLTFATQRRRSTCTIWSLDVAKATWRRHGQLNWKWPLSQHGAYASSPAMYSMGFDPRAALVVFTENVVTGSGGGRAARELTCVMKLDLATLPAEAAPEFKPDPPIRQHALPADDPAHVAKLKALPANTWVPAEPKPDDIGRRNPTRRDWGIAACDPVRGHVYYFGGGHATYQVRDVAIYAVGANRWVHAYGEHNDFLPPNSWSGVSFGYRGGPAASHQRNSYVALDGRMYKGIGAKTMRPRYSDPAMARRGRRWTHFYDLDWGGVWRRMRIPGVVWGKGIKGTYGAVHLAHPAGKVIGFGGRLEPYEGRECPPGVATFASYDVARDALRVTKIPAPMPDWVGECRPFCCVPDRGKAGSVLYYEWRKKGGHRTWCYDIATNRFQELKPRRQPPPGDVGTIEYLAGQRAAWAVIRGTDKTVSEWVYSFEHNTWAPFPSEGSRPKSAWPYGQTVYSAKYGVLVNVRTPTQLLRPDLSTVEWE